MNDQSNSKEIILNDKQNVQYNTTIRLINNILYLSLTTNKIDYYKSYFTHERLLRKNNSLSFLTSTLIDAYNLIIKYLEESSYNLLVDKEKAFSLLIIDKLSDGLNQVDSLEIFLYKNDSNKYEESIENLKNNIILVKEESTALEKEINNDIEALTLLINENLQLKKDFTDLKSYLNTKTEEAIEKFKNDNLYAIDNNEIKLKITKKDLIVASSSIKVEKKLLFKYLPILLDSERELLKTWFNTDKFELILAFDSIINGNTSNAFHQKCDGKVQTITFIESEQGRRFGGYTKLLWNSDENEKYKGNDPSAFIFSLDKRIKLQSNNDNIIIYCDNNYGPCFGKGDIIISDNFNQQESSSRLLNSYGKHELSEKTRTNIYLAGIENFIVKRIEVYQVIFK